MLKKIMKKSNSFPKAAVSEDMGIIAEAAAAAAGGTKGIP